MGKHSLNRYERDSQGQVLIDVSAARIEDLYNDFDKSAPYIRRDLDIDLVGYLINCVREIQREPFVLRCSLGKALDAEVENRVRGSLNSYFLYLVEDEKRRLAEMLRRSVILLAVGLSILFVAIRVNATVDQQSSVMASVFASGLTVAAWVSLWEAFAVFLIEWFPHQANIRRYRRLSAAQVLFRAEPGLGRSGV